MGSVRFPKREKQLGKCHFQATFPFLFSQTIQLLKPGAEFGRPEPMGPPRSRPRPLLFAGWKAGPV